MNLWHINIDSERFSQWLQRYRELNPGFRWPCLIMSLIVRDFLSWCWRKEQYYHVSDALAYSFDALWRSLWILDAVTQTGMSQTLWLSDALWHFGQNRHGCKDCSARENECLGSCIGLNRQTRMWNIKHTALSMLKAGASATFLTDIVNARWSPFGAAHSPGSLTRPNH